MFCSFEIIFISITMVSFVAVVLTLLSIYLLSNLWSFLNNYREARKSNLPIVICPVYPNNGIWQIFSVPLYPYFRYLPSFLWDRIKIAIYGWELFDRGQVHSRVGKAFLLVSPGSIELWTADPDISGTVMARRKDFMQMELTSC